MQSCVYPLLSGLIYFSMIEYVTLRPLATLVWDMELFWAVTIHWTGILYWTTELFSFFSDIQRNPNNEARRI